MQNTTSYSKIIAGTMTWGTWGKRFSKEQMVDIMHHCIEVGISTFDHADIYGGYTTEADFGLAFKESNISREEIQLITKCGIQLNAATRPNIVAHYEYSEEYIIYSVDQSLKNLNTEYIDMLLLHRPSPLMNPEPISAAIRKLQSEGKVKDFGVSNFTPSQIAMLEKQILIISNQVEFSLTANQPMYEGTLDDCIANSRMAMSWSPLGGVFKEKTEQVQRIQKVLEKMMVKYNATKDQLLLAWVLKHPAKVHPVVGTATKSRLTNAVEALKIDLELSDWFMLLEASKGHQVP